MFGNRLVAVLRLFLGEVAVVRDVRLLEMLLHGLPLVRGLGVGRLRLRGEHQQRQGEQCEADTHGGNPPGGAMSRQIVRSMLTDR
jgi:hypothetical protein